MTEVSTIGLDIAKTVSRSTVSMSRVRPVIRRQLRRRQVLPFFGKQPACPVSIPLTVVRRHDIDDFGCYLGNVG